MKSTVKWLVVFSLILLPLNGFAQLLGIDTGAVSTGSETNTEEENSPVENLIDLPKGVKLVGPTFLDDPKDERSMYVESELTIDKNADVKPVIKQLNEQGMLGSQALAEMITHVSSWFKGEPIQLKAKMHIPVGRQPYVAFSHLIVGDIKPSTPKRHHTIEISETVLQKVSAKALRDCGVTGQKHEYDYSLHLPLLGKFKRIGYVRLRSLYPVCKPGVLEVHCDKTYAFAPVMGENKGVSLNSKKVKGALSFKRVLGKSNVIEVAANFCGEHKMDAGAGWFDGLVQKAIAKVAEQFFPDLGKLLDKTARDTLDEILPIVKGEVALQNVKIGSKGLRFNLAPIQFNLGQTVEVLLGQKTPVDLDDLSVRHDRITLGLTNNFVAVTD